MRTDRISSKGKQGIWEDEEGGIRSMFWRRNPSIWFTYLITRSNGRSYTCICTNTCSYTSWLEAEETKFLRILGKTFQRNFWMFQTKPKAHGWILKEDHFRKANQDFSGKNRRNRKKERQREKWKNERRGTKRTGRYWVKEKEGSGVKYRKSKV